MTNHNDSGLYRHPTTTRGFTETVNWDLKDPEFFKLFSHDLESGTQVNLVPFLQEWQRTMVLNGGARVLTAYLKWIDHLRHREPDAETVFLMGEFFLAMRKDVGLSN